MTINAGADLYRRLYQSSEPQKPQKPSLDDDIAAFLKNGGEIKHVAQGATGIKWSGYKAK